MPSERLRRYGHPFWRATVVHPFASLTTLAAYLLAPGPNLPQALTTFAIAICVLGGIVATVAMAWRLPGVGRGRRLGLVATGLVATPVVMVVCGYVLFYALVLASCFFGQNCD